jgi:hypothetical protein
VVKQGSIASGLGELKRFRVRSKLRVPFAWPLAAAGWRGLARIPVQLGSLSFTKCLDFHTGDSAGDPVSTEIATESLRVNLWSKSFILVL